MVKNVIFIKAYVNLNNEEFDNLNSDEVYDGYRGIWRISKNKVDDLKYAFAIHKNIIKNVYLIHAWHNGNTTQYRTRKINPNDPKIKERLEFTGKIAFDMQHFIGKDVSLYYNKGEANPIKYMELDQLQNLIREYIVYPDDIDDNDLFEGSKKQITVNAYERSLQARQNCIAHYGTKCVICSFDFKIIGFIWSEKNSGITITTYNAANAMTFFISFKLDAGLRISQGPCFRNLVSIIVFFYKRKNIAFLIVFIVSNVSINNV